MLFFASFSFVFLVLFVSVLLMGARTKAKWLRTEWMTPKLNHAVRRRSCRGEGLPNELCLLSHCRCWVTICTEHYSSLPLSIEQSREQDCLYIIGGLFVHTPLLMNHWTHIYNSQTQLCLLTVLKRVFCWETWLIKSFYISFVCML